MFLFIETMQKLRKRTNGLDDVAKALARLNDSAKIERLLRELLTPAECRDLASRWDILKLMKQGRSQRSVANELKVSLCKVTRGARILRKGDSVVETLLGTDN